MKFQPKYKVASLLLTSAILAGLSGCDTKSSDYDFNQTSSSTKAPELPHGPVFDPANSKIPATNDLLFKDSKDGTLNIPNDADNDGKPDNPIIAQINQLDGFSTTNPITIDYGIQIDPATLKIGETVRAFEVIKDGGLIKSVTRELTVKELVAIQASDKKLAIVPLIPLNGNTSYLILLSKGIKDRAGKPSSPPSAYFLAKSDIALVGDYGNLGKSPSFAGLKALISNAEEAAFQFDPNLKKDDIIMSWSFTTQSINDVLTEVADKAVAGNIVAIPIGKTTKDIKDTLPGYANISIGTLEIPYYLEAPSKDNPTTTLTSYWKGLGGSALTRFNKSPIETTKLTIPLMMTTPNAGAEIKDPNGNVVATVPAKPADGWPIVIYQHGITRMRTDVIAYADSLAAAGFAVIAIDLPLHGVSELLEDGTANPFHTNNTKTALFIHPSFDNDVEPTFDLDFVNNKTGAVGPDNIADESGKHFMNLKSLLTSRDNIRQGVSNLLVLRRSLTNLAGIDATKVGFISHSLGGIVGIPYLAVEEKSLPSSLIATGVGIRNMLLDSDPFGLEIKAGLKANGIEGKKYDAFMYATQFILESADPVNYSADAAKTHPIHIIEIEGDKVVVNKTTEAMSSLMQAKTISATTNDISSGKPGIVRFTQGNHSSVLDPTRGGNFLNVFTEIHTQLATFQATQGTTIKVTDSSIIKQ